MDATTNGSEAGIQTNNNYEVRLNQLLAQNLDFHHEAGNYASQNFHAFPAKFPPQLPRTFIEGLTQPGELVLDPMIGSGTTLVEALLTGRAGIGFDIDPLALHLCQVKITPLSVEPVACAGQQVINQAVEALEQHNDQLAQTLEQRFDDKTRQFIDYWFLSKTQMELLALIMAIEAVSEPPIRQFLNLTFSAIIITKSGGVSMARDLAHTRPHRVENKRPRSAIAEFRRRLQQNLKSLEAIPPQRADIQVRFGDVQALPLADESVDLIVTSPPYVANAIDYMRAHKFSLVWLNHKIDDLGQKRKAYIGGEAFSSFAFEALPPQAAKIVRNITALDATKGKVLHRYYSEMTRSLGEMFRVLKPGKASIVVVGTSKMRGTDTQTQSALCDIGQQIGFKVVKVAVRKLDRNRRMLPVQRQQDLSSQIEQRMHEEYVIGFYKPMSAKRNYL